MVVWIGVGLRRVLLCAVGQDTQGGSVVPKAQGAVRIGCRPQEGGPDVPRLGEWTRTTEGPVRADQSYYRLREWTRWIEGPGTGGPITLQTRCMWIDLEGGPGGL